MIWPVAVVTLFLAVLVAACCAALVEVFRNLADIRAVLNLQDRPAPLKLKLSDATVDRVGLPEEMRRQPESIVVFLSSKCGTCLTIAEAFHGGAPASVWFVISGASPADVMLEKLVASRGRVVVDEDDQIAFAIGLNVTPSVLSLSYGEITRAHVVSSARQVLAMIPTVLSSADLSGTHASLTETATVEGGAHA